MASEKKFVPGKGMVSVDNKKGAFAKGNPPAKGTANAENKKGAFAKGNPPAKKATPPKKK